MKPIARRGGERERCWFQRKRRGGVGGPRSEMEDGRRTVRGGISLGSRVGESKLSDVPEGQRGRFGRGRAAYSVALKAVRLAIDTC